MDNRECPNCGSDNCCGCGSTPKVKEHTCNMYCDPDECAKKRLSSRKESKVSHKCKCKKKSSPKSIRDWQKEIHKCAEEHGWWEDKNRNVAEQLALMHSEISEALEEYRHGRKLNEVWYSSVPVHLGELKKPEGFGVELVDCIIRILDTAEAYNIDIEDLMNLKHAFNQNRSYRHGNKKA